MAHFSNGTEGMMYEDRYCQHCRHYDEQDGCPIINIHLLFNYEQCGDTQHNKDMQSILTLLIPRSEDGLVNEKCNFFIAADPGDDGVTPVFPELKGPKDNA